MKKFVMIGLLAVLCVVLAIGTTLAFNTSEETGVNVVTMGNIKIATVQTAIPDGEEEPIPFEGGYKIIPGKVCSWILEVENRCDNDAYVRVNVNNIITLAKGIDGIPDANIMNFNYNTENWQLKDGYYYYKEPLKAGAKTEPLFTKVTFDKKAGNIYQSASADAVVLASATQVKNNGSNVFEAAGWPDNK